MARYIKNTKRFGQGVKRKREELRWTQSELGRRSGFTQATISKIEIGIGGVGSETIDRLGKVLGFTREEALSLAPEGGRAVENLDGLEKKMDSMCSKIERMESRLNTGVPPVDVPVITPMPGNVPAADVSAISVGQLTSIVEKQGEEIKELKEGVHERASSQDEDEVSGLDVLFSELVEKFKELAKGVDLKKRFFTINVDAEKLEEQIYIDVCVAIAKGGEDPYVKIGEGFFEDEKTVGQEIAQIIYKSISQEEDEEDQGETLKRVVAIAQGEDDPGEDDSDEGWI